MLTQTCFDTSPYHLLIIAYIPAVVPTPFRHDFWLGIEKMKSREGALTILDTKNVLHN